MTYTLDQIKEMLEKIPAGEWINHGCFAQCGQVWSMAEDYPVAWCDTRECGEGPNQEQIQNVANFIAASPAIVRQLLQMLGDPSAANARLWKDWTEAKKLIAELEDYMEMDRIQYENDKAYKKMLLQENEELKKKITIYT